MQALIDGDLIAYRCAASAENDPVEVAIKRADLLTIDLLTATLCDSYRMFISGNNNFRVSIDPNYKANRKDKPKPVHLVPVQEFLIKSYNAEVTDGYEADDALGINQQEHSTVIVSLDKDLLQIPGHHYQWEISGRPAKWFEQNYLDGLRHFYASSLIGDVSDNIRGVDGIGKVKAKRALQDLETEQELFDKCRELYGDDPRYFKNLRLLWILRNENEFFNEIERGLIALQE